MKRKNKILPVIVTDIFDVHTVDGVSVAAIRGIPPGSRMPPILPSESDHTAYVTAFKDIAKLMEAMNEDNFPACWEIANKIYNSVHILLRGSSIDRFDVVLIKNEYIIPFACGSVVPVGILECDAVEPAVFEEILQFMTVYNLVNSFDKVDNGFMVNRDKLQHALMYTAAVSEALSKKLSGNGHDKDNTKEDDEDTSLDDIIPNVLN